MVEEDENIELILRKGKNANGEEYLYFYSRSGSRKFFIDAKRVKDLLEGKRNWVFITVKEVRYDREGVNDTPTSGE